MKKFKIAAIAVVILFALVFQVWAYTATITKQSVTKSGQIYTVVLAVVINDGASNVLNFTISARHNPNAPDMSAVMATLQSQIKEKWDGYVDNQGVFNATVLDNGVSTLQTQTNTYINQ